MHEKMQISKHILVICDCRHTEEFGIFRKTKENKINRLKMGKVVHTNKSTMFLY